MARSIRARRICDDRPCSDDRPDRVAPDISVTGVGAPYRLADAMDKDHLPRMDSETKHADTLHAENGRAEGRSGGIWPIAAYLIYWQIAPRIRDDRIGTVLISTLVSLALVVVVTGTLARGVQSTRRALALTMLAAAVVVPIRVMAAFGYMAPPWRWIVAVPGLADLGFIGLGAGCGILLSHLVRSANMVPPVAAVLALVDIWTVTMGGPVHQIMTSDRTGAQKVVEAMTVRLPATTAGAAPIAVVGFADFLFIAFFTAAMCRFAGTREGYRRTVWPLAVILSLYMLVVLITGLRLPALVPMAVVVIATHWKRFHYARSEVFALLDAGLVIAVIIAGAVLMGALKT